MNAMRLNVLENILYLFVGIMFGCRFEDCFMKGSSRSCIIFFRKSAAPKMEMFSELLEPRPINLIESTEFVNDVL